MYAIHSDRLSILYMFINPSYIKTHFHEVFFWGEGECTKCCGYKPVQMIQQLLTRFFGRTSNMQVPA